MEPMSPSRPHSDCTYRGGGNQYGVVNFPIRCAQTPSVFHIAGRTFLLPCCTFPAIARSALSFSENGRAFKIALDIEDEIFIAFEMIGGESPVSGLAEVTIVLRRHVGGDEFALDLVYATELLPVRRAA
jgi:hypothetical protein